MNFQSEKIWFFMDATGWINSESNCILPLSKLLNTNSTYCIKATIDFILGLSKSFQGIFQKCSRLTKMSNQLHSLQRSYFQCIFQKCNHLSLLCNQLHLILYKKFKTFIIPLQCNDSSYLFQIIAKWIMNTF